MSDELWDIMTAEQHQKHRLLRDEELELDKLYEMADQLQDSLRVRCNVAKAQRIAYEQSILRDRASKDPTLPVVP